eukprot:gene15740-13760_t
MAGVQCWQEYGRSYAQPAGRTPSVIRRQRGVRRVRPAAGGSAAGDGAAGRRARRRAIGAADKRDLE